MFTIPPRNIFYVLSFPPDTLLYSKYSPGGKFTIQRTFPHSQLIIPPDILLHSKCSPLIRVFTIDSELSTLIVLILIVIYHYSFIHSLWHIYICIHPQTLVWVSLYSSTTSGMGLFLFIHNLCIGFFLLIHNLCHRYLFIHPHPLVWVSFYSSTTSGIGLFLFIHNLWYRSLVIHPHPLEQVPFYSSTTSGMVFFLIIHNLCHGSLFIHPHPLA